MSGHTFGICTRLKLAHQWRTGDALVAHLNTGGS